MHIALVHVNRGVDASPISPAIDHLGLEMIAGKLKAAGYNVKQFDTLIQYLTMTTLFECLKSYRPTIIGFSVNYTNIIDVKNICCELKKALPTTLLLAGGPYASFHYRQLLRSKHFDFIVIGYGEDTLQELIEKIETKKSWENISGLAWQEKDLQYNPPNIKSSFSLLPMADRALLPLFKTFPHDSFKVAIESSRGCFQNCAFCSISALQRMGKNFGFQRFRSPTYVAEEIHILYKSYGIRDFWLMDPDFLGFPGNSDWVIEFANTLTDVPIKLSPFFLKLSCGEAGFPRPKKHSNVGMFFC